MSNDTVMDKFALLLAAGDDTSLSRKKDNINRRCANNAEYTTPLASEAKYKKLGKRLATSGRNSPKLRLEI